MTVRPERAVSPKLLYALGAVIAVVLLFVFVVNPLLLSTEHADDPVTLPVPTPPDDALDEQVDEDVPETLEVFTARDPFHQLVTSAPGS